MADPTAAAHGVAKVDAGTAGTSTNTLVSDSGTVAVGDWLVCLIGGFFLTSKDYTIAKTAGTSTVGASVTPTSPGATVASIEGDDGSGNKFRAKAMYLPVTGAGTLTVTVTRTAGTTDQAWAVHFVRVQNPGSVGAVGIIQDNVSSTTITVTMDAANAATSLALMHVFNNNGNGAITQPSGTSELLDTAMATFGAQLESAKKEGSPSTANQFTALPNTGAFGRAAVAVEIKTAAAAGVFSRNVFVRQAVSRAAVR